MLNAGLYERACWCYPREVAMEHGSSKHVMQIHHMQGPRSVNMCGSEHFDSPRPPSPSSLGLGPALSFRVTELDGDAGEENVTLANGLPDLSVLGVVDVLPSGDRLFDGWP